MRVFNEKCDRILCFLKDSGKTGWHVLFIGTNMKQNDGIITYLKRVKGFLDYSENEIHITKKGKDFISKTSFADQRDKVVL
jgi:predicted transcriptional regulator